MTDQRKDEMPEKIYVQVHTKSHYWSIYPLKTVEYVEYTRASQPREVEDKKKLREQVKMLREALSDISNRGCRCDSSFRAEQALQQTEST